MSLFNSTSIGQEALEAKELQDIVYAVGNAHQFEPLRDWFQSDIECFAADRPLCAASVCCGRVLAAGHGSHWRFYRLGLLRHLWRPGLLFVGLPCQSGNRLRRLVAPAPGDPWWRPFVARHAVLDLGHDARSQRCYGHGSLGVDQPGHHAAPWPALWRRIGMGSHIGHIFVRSVCYATWLVRTRVSGRCGVQPDWFQECRADIGKKPYCVQRLCRLLCGVP